MSEISGPGREERPIVRDKRRIDPETGEVRRPPAEAPASANPEGEAVTPSDADQFVPEGEFGGDGLEAPLEPPARETDSVVAAKISELEELAAERTADLQRLHAEYVNYKRRVDRDRSLARLGGIEAVVLDLLPVLDSVEAAREHDELTGGFRLVADELEKVAAKYGLEVYGEIGDPFDPQIHEALMQLPMEAVEVTTCSAIMQKGVRLNGRVLRPARVAVAEPE